MSMKLYVGNLSFDTSSNELQTLFAQTGTVESVSLIEDRETGRSRGYGFSRDVDEGRRRSGD
jgi:RNA recognition motif-containing protein